jgi:hypothetical protein
MAGDEPPQKLKILSQALPDESCLFLIHGGDARTKHSVEINDSGYDAFVDIRHSFDGREPRPTDRFAPAWLI